MEKQILELIEEAAKAEEEIDGQDLETFLAEQEEKEKRIAFLRERHRIVQERRAEKNKF